MGYVRKVSDNQGKDISDKRRTGGNMASLKKSFRVSPELWEGVQCAKLEGETDSAAICRLLTKAIEETEQDSDTSHLWAQIDRKDEQIRALSALLDEANTAKLTALLETCQATATQTRTLVRLLDAPKVVEARLADIETGTKKRSWLDRLFG